MVNKKPDQLFFILPPCAPPSSVFSVSFLKWRFGESGSQLRFRPRLTVPVSAAYIETDGRCPVAPVTNIAGTVLKRKEL